MILAIVFSTNAASHDLPINRYFCSSVFSKIEDIQEKQRRGNRVKQAERLNRRMRHFKKHRDTCKTHGYTSL